MAPKKKPTLTGASIGWDGKPVGHQEAIDLAENLRLQRIRQRAEAASDQHKRTEAAFATPKAKVKPPCIECHNTHKPTGYGHEGSWCRECYDALLQSRERDRALVRQRVITAGVPPEFERQWVLSHKDELLKNGHSDYVDRILNGA